MARLEQALSETEATAERVRESSARVVSQARALSKAAQTGNLSGIKRAWQKLTDAFSELGRRVSDAGPGWPFTEEEERQLFAEEYAGALQAVAAEKGLRLYERDGLLLCYPSVVRILPADRAVRVDRKKISTIRPAYLVNLLLQKQQKASGYPSQLFLESLYSVYTELRRGTSSSTASGLPLAGDVVPLARIYGLLTALPGASRDYDRTDFARDLYVLDSSGPSRTKSGATVSFPASTGTRRRSADLFSFVGPEGDAVEYYGIRFREDGA